MTPTNGSEDRRVSRRVRPYALTGGRTRAASDLPLETLIVTRAGVVARGHTPEHTVILQSCTRPVSLVEIAGELSVPAGVARVLVGDLIDAGAVEVHRPDTARPAHRDLEILAEVLNGIESL